MNIQELPKTIPIFPLSNFIMFPGTTVPLNIFEPRYISMIDQCMKKDRLLGMAQPKGMTNNKMPELFRLLEPINTTQSLATIILLMTVKTVDEVCGMRWSELDLVNRVWVIPPERTKNKKLHKCPLSSVSFKIIDVLKYNKINDYVFNSLNKKISTNAPRDLLRSVINKKEEEFKAVESTKLPTAQGIRHSFKKWCNNRYVPQEYSNYQLGHYNTKIAKIYNEYDFFEERKNLCNAWDDFISNKSIEDYLRGNDLIENIIENNINFDNLISKKTD